VTHQVIGALGPTDSVQAIIHWYPFYNYPALLLWTIFVLILYFGTAHRHRSAWLILIPAGLIHLVWLFIKTTCGFSTSEGVLIGQIIIPLYITIALLFALSAHLRRPNRFISFFLALLVVALSGLASFFAYNYSGTYISQTNQLALVFSVIMGVAFLLGVTIAVLLSRKRPDRLKFTAWLLIFTFLFNVVFVFFYGLYDFGPSDLDDYMEVMIVSLIFGLSLCGVVLPYLIFSFVTPHYRRILSSLISQQSALKELIDTEGEMAS
jgi:hypothetical protein